MPTATRIKKSDTRIPQNLEEADRLVGVIGVHQAEIDGLEAAAESEIARIKEALRTSTEKARKERNKALTGVFAFAEAHKRELTKEGKTLNLTNGSISWRWTPPAVSVKDDQKMIALLADMGMSEFIRTKEELDREALLVARPRVPGLAFTQREEFIVKPGNSSDVTKTRTIILE